MNWSDKKSFSEKFAAILRDIDKLIAAGYKVSLVAASAGASAAINAYGARRKSIRKVVCVCGKLRNFGTINTTTYSRNPAFQESLEMLRISLPELSVKERYRILSLRPLSDNVVPPTDTVVEGAQSGTLPTIGHTFTIVYALTFGSLRIAGFIKR
jgi:hypothetical protein